jgi:erythromycin esterase
VTGIPALSLDDLEPLRDVIGSARVVGIGETAHHVREYQQLRNRLVRFLVERMGFGVVAFESGFSEGLAVDRWVRGGTGDLTADLAENGLTYRFGRSSETRRLLTWMRDADVRYTGIDLPGDLASMLPALDNLDRYLAAVDPDAVETLAGVRRHAEKYAGPYTIAAFAAYRAMAPADRDQLTLLLAELATRFDTLRPVYVRRSDAGEFGTARHELRLAGLLDQMLRAQSASADGSMAHAVVNVRDAAMADTVLRLVRDTTTRVVLLAGNPHLQRIPVPLGFKNPGGGNLELPVAGMYLADELGDDYLAVAMTCAGGRVPTRRAAPESPRGAEIVDVDLVEPVAGSVEAVLPFAELGEHVADLRPLRTTDGTPQRIRSLDSYAEVPVAFAFDLVAAVPTITPLPPDER